MDQVGVMPDSSHLPAPRIDALESVDLAGVEEATAVVPPTESAPASMPVPNLAVSMNYADMAAPDGDISYDPPVFLHMNFGRYPLSMELPEGTGI